ncbi:MAG: BlaI/MecI/CopY family transcriptional regulator [Muribaculaceae bacterium]|nr:BlaI/MecI/CopY family transcriptional regulator [Muribaculaceae bacterium]
MEKNKKKIDEPDGKKPHLTVKEEEVMRILWENGPMLVKEVLEYLPEPRPHVNTVSTVIRVLEKKGYVGHKKEVGTYRYHAILEKDTYRRTTLMTMLRNYFDNSLKSMVSALVQEEQLSEEEIKDCIDIIEKKRH